MLESIIKKYLFEAREFKSVVKKADTRSYDDAMAAGALYAFDVVYKIRMGKDALPTEKEIMDSLSNIISANPSVGASSKYAKSKHTYVLSNNLKDSERRMKWNVWIIPGNVANDIDSDAVNVSATYPYKIGVSHLISFKNLNTTEQTKYKNINKGAPVTASADAVTEPTAVVNDPVPVTTSIESGVAPENLFKIKSTDPAQSSTIPSKITYPYTAVDGNVIYTMSLSDPYIYTYMNDTWRTMKKKDFEARKASSGILITDPKTNSRLNTEFDKAANIYGIGSDIKINDTLQFKRKVGDAVDLYWWSGKSGFAEVKNKQGVKQWFKINTPAELNVIYKGPSAPDPSYTGITFPTETDQRSIKFYVKTQDINFDKNTYL